MSILAIDEVTHKQAPIFDNGEVIFTVDKKLQRLIQFLWDHGIITYNSCQNNVKGRAWIQYDLESWLLMNEIAFRDETRELYDFIQEECEVKLLSWDDGEPDENDECWIEGENLEWTASVRFHKRHLKKFERYIREAFDD